MCHEQAVNGPADMQTLDWAVLSSAPFAPPVDKRTRNGYPVYYARASAARTGAQGHDYYSLIPKHIMFLDYDDVL